MYQEGRLERSARDLCYNDGVALIAERGSGAISFCDFQKRVQVDVKSLKKKLDLRSYLQGLGLDTGGTVRTLKDQLKEYLCQIADTI